MTDEEIFEEESPQEIAAEPTAEEIEAAEKAARFQAIAELIRDCGKKEQYLSLTDLCQEIGREKEAVTADLEEMKASEEYKDICVYTGAKDSYYYTYPLLAHNYVRNLVLAREDDKIRNLAECIRYESQTYPRAMKVDTMTSFPYFYTKPQVQELFNLMKEANEYQDIQTFESAKGNTYYFSTLYLTERRAKALVEYQEDMHNWM